MSGNKILIGTLGTSPAVFTEVLAEEKDITDVVIFYTKNPRVKGGAKLLKVAIWDLFKTVKNIELVELESEDVKNEEEMYEFLEKLNQTLKKYRIYELKFLISGGRKSQTALLYFLALINQAKEVLHVAYNEPISSANEALRNYLNDFAEMNYQEIKEIYKNKKDFFKEILLDNNVSIVKLPTIPITAKYIGNILSIIQNPEISSTEIRLTKTEIVEALEKMGYLEKTSKFGKYKPTEKAKKIMRLFK